MAAFTDFYNPTNAEYLFMDPHELGNGELRYEMALRNLNVFGTSRAWAAAIKGCLEQERTSRQPPHCLSESPYPAERDIKECREMCDWLEQETEGRLLDRRTLTQKLQQCIHIMARLARIRYRDVQQMNELHQLQQKIIMLRYRYRIRLDPQIDAREIMETFSQQNTPIVTAIPTPAPLPRVSTGQGRIAAAKLNARAKTYELPKPNASAEATAMPSPIANTISTTPVSATITPIVSERITITPKVTARTATSGASKGAIPKTVEFGKLPFSQPEMGAWRSPSDRSPQSDEDWDISRMLSGFHISPERTNAIPKQETEVNRSPIIAATPRQSVKPAAERLPASGPVLTPPSMPSNVQNAPAKTTTANGPYVTFPNTPNNTIGNGNQVILPNQQLLQRQFPMPYSMMMPFYGPIPQGMAQSPFQHIPFVEMQRFAQPIPAANVAQPNWTLQNCLPAQPVQNENANANDCQERRERPRHQNGNHHNAPPPSSESSNNGSDDERNNNNRRGGRRPHSDSRSSRSDTHDENERDGARRVNGTGRHQHVKSVPINQWRISFSGSETSANKHDVNVHQFLEQIELFRKAGRITEKELLDQVIHLLSGNARDWYQHAHRRIRTWQQFATELRQKFLPSDYNFDLVAQAHRRKQGKGESVSAYISAMELLFQSMSIPMAEQQKVAIIRANLASQYDDAVATKNPQTIAAIEAICKRIESTRRARKENSAETAAAKPFRPRYGKVNAAEEINTDSHGTSDSESDRSEANACAAINRADGKQNKITKQARRSDKPAGTAKDKQTKVNSVETCFNCRAQGHDQRDCTRKWKKHCYVCGWEGVVARECPKCNPDLPKNGKVNSLEAEQDSSQSETAHHD